MDDEEIYPGSRQGLERAAQERLERPKEHGGFATRELLEQAADWLTGLSGTEAEVVERIKASGLTPEEVQEAIYEISYRAGRQRFLDSH